MIRYTPAVGLICVMAGGCAMRQSIPTGRFDPADQASESPPATLLRGDNDRAAGLTEVSDAIQQGTVPIAIQGVTGFQINQALPWTMAVLLAWVVYLSHRREMIRLRFGLARGPRKPLTPDEH